MGAPEGRGLFVVENHNIIGGVGGVLKFRCAITSVSDVLDLLVYQH